MAELSVLLGLAYVKVANICSSHVGSQLPSDLYALPSLARRYVLSNREECHLEVSRVEESSQEVDSA